MAIDLIVACDFSGSIGKDGGIPWHVPDDLKRFKTITTYTLDKNKTNAVLMGRKTWESLPCKPLPGRVNLIVSSTLEPSINGAIVCRSINDAVEYIDHQRSHIENAFIIGGSRLYSDMLKHPSTRFVFLTMVHTMVDGCDAKFPLKYLSDAWVEMDDFYSGSQYSPSQGLFYSHHVFRRGVTQVNAHSLGSDSGSIDTL